MYTFPIKFHGLTLLGSHLLWTPQSCFSSSMGFSFNAMYGRACDFAWLTG